MCIGEGELAVSVELALDGGVYVQLVGSTHCELGGGSLLFVEVEGGIEPSGGIVGYFVEVGHSDLVALEQTEEGEDVVGGGVCGGAIHCREGSAGVLGLQTHRESLISHHSGKGGLSSLIVQHVHGSIQGYVVVLVLTIKLDGIEFFGINLYTLLGPVTYARTYNI